MRTFKYHPDNIIYINSDDFEYSDYTSGFAYDCAKCDLDLIPEKPSKVREYLVDEENPNSSYVKDRNCNPLSFNDLSAKQEDFYIYIASIQPLLKAQKDRGEKRHG